MKITRPTPADVERKVPLRNTCGCEARARLGLKAVQDFQLELEGCLLVGDCRCKIAEQVEKVNPDLVVGDEDVKVSTVRYEAVNAMLLDEFLKEHRKVEKLEPTVATQEKDFEATVAQQQKQIEAFTVAVRRVSDH